MSRLTYSIPLGDKGGQARVSGETFKARIGGRWIQFAVQDESTRLDHVASGRTIIDLSTRLIRATLASGRAKVNRVSVAKTALADLVDQHGAEKVLATFAAAPVLNAY